MYTGLAKQFEDALVQLINTCNLPIETAYYIVKNQVLELEILYNNILTSNIEQSIKDKDEQIKTTIDVPLTTDEADNTDIIE